MNTTTDGGIPCASADGVSVLFLTLKLRWMR